MEQKYSKKKNYNQKILLRCAGFYVFLSSQKLPWQSLRVVLSFIFFAFQWLPLNFNVREHIFMYVSSRKLGVREQFSSLLFSTQRVFCFQHKWSFVFKHLCQYCIVLYTKGLFFQAFMSILYCSQHKGSFVFNYLCIVLNTKGLLY